MRVFQKRPWKVDIKMMQPQTALADCEIPWKRTQKVRTGTASSAKHQLGGEAMRF